MMMKKHLNKWIYFLYLLPFAALLCDAWVLDSAFALGTGRGKEYWFYIMLGPVILATILSYVHRRKNLRHNAIDIWILLLGALVGAVTYTALPTWNMQIPTLVLLIVLYYCFRIFIVQKRDYLPILLWVWMTTGLIEAGWGLLQLYGILPSQHNLFLTTGSFFNPGPYAGYLAMIFPVALYYVLRDRKVFKTPFHKKKTLFYIRWITALCTMVLTLLVLPATMSRAAWLAIPLGSIAVYIQLRMRRKMPFFYFSYYWGVYRKDVFKWGGIGMIALITTVGLLYTLKKDSADGRLMIWKVALNTFKDQNVLGYGIGTFAGYYGEAQAQYMKSGKASEQEKLLAGEPIYAFNEMVQLYVELGLLCLLITIGIWIWALYTGIRRQQVAPVGSLIALLTFACMSYPFSLMPFLIALTFLLAACVSTMHEIKHHPRWFMTHNFPYEDRRVWNNIWVIVLLTTCTAIYTYLVWDRTPVYRAYKSWHTARPLYYSGAYKQTAEAYEKLWPYIPTDVEFLFEYGQALSKIEDYKESSNVLEEAARYSSDPMIFVILGKNKMALGYRIRAGEIFNQAINRVPHRLYPHYAWAKASFEQKDWTVAEREARHVLQKTPKVESPATKEMKQEMKILLEKIEIEKLDHESDEKI